MKFLNAIDRYIFRLVLMPMIGIFLLAASLLVMDKMLRLFDFVATEGGPIGVVFKMLINLLPEYASLAIPLGLMLGILLAFRKLATSSELDVMRAVGLSYTRLLRVPYILAILLAGANFAIVGYLQPLARYAYEELNYELKSGALGASIKVGEFTSLKDRIALRIDESQDDGRRLIGIFARVADRNGQVMSISAREGQFLALKGQPDTIILRLNNGQIIQDMPGRDPRVLSFTRHDLPIELPQVERFRQRGGQDREYLLPELMRLGWNKSLPREERISSQANFNFRMVEVIMMLLLPLLAVALAIPPKRSTSALGLFVSIVMVVAYHKVNQYAADVASLGRINPILGLWGPFALFGALIVWMYWRVAYVPGGQAIGWLEKGSDVVIKWFKSLLKRRRHGPILPEPAPESGA
ncbi:lipopolysaccharide export system permease protein [Novosphingobium sp. PhB165]|uniref:LPS export ABC transporter permease LptF n=1 Tax=Novosphingobium sp. PhB165 TaxID=2485105 RepID=UPI001050B9D6|nr:LPS export ABC transporter permease LptF [Novosphingobium sp. PhB165]TCM17762.1 lipopolysaccharide export system permease protein [Novosphingobium sp. PhB165]